MDELLRMSFKRRTVPRLLKDEVDEVLEVEKGEGRITLNLIDARWFHIFF